MLIPFLTGWTRNYTMSLTTHETKNFVQTSTDYSQCSVFPHKKGNNEVDMNNEREIEGTHLAHLASYRYHHHPVYRTPRMGQMSCGSKVCDGGQGVGWLVPALGLLIGRFSDALVMESLLIWPELLTQLGLAQETELAAVPEPGWWQQPIQSHSFHPSSLSNPYTFLFVLPPSLSSSLPPPPSLAPFLPPSL